MKYIRILLWLVPACMCTSQPLSQAADVLHVPIPIHVIITFTFKLEDSGSLKGYRCVQSLIHYKHAVYGCMLCTG